MILRLIRVVTLTREAPTTDRRRRLNRAIVEYRDEENQEYRKVFESYDDPRIPESGTHAELNRLAEAMVKVTST